MPTLVSACWMDVSSSAPSATANARSISRCVNSSSRVAKSFFDCLTSSSGGAPFSKLNQRRNVRLGIFKLSAMRCSSKWFSGYPAASSMTTAPALNLSVYTLRFAAMPSSQIYPPRAYVFAPASPSASRAVGFGVAAGLCQMKRGAARCAPAVLVGFGMGTTVTMASATVTLAFVRPSSAEGLCSA